MRKLLCIAILFCYSTVCEAQSARHAGFTIGLPDLQNALFFEKNPAIQRIDIHYDDNLPIGISLHHTQQGRETSDEFYDLEFAGDKYLLQTTYESIVVPANPTIHFNYLKSSPSLSHYDYGLTTSILKDSIIYNWNVNLSEARDDIGILKPKLTTAMYLQGDEKLQEGLISAYVKSQAKSPFVLKDSVFMFQGIVHPDGNMSDIELVLGQPSSFTELIKSQLQQREGLWKPAIQGGRHVKSLIDIFIHTRDGEILSVSSSGWNRKKKS